MHLEEWTPKVPPEQACTSQGLLLRPQREQPAAILEEVLQKVSPEVWADGRPEKAKTATPVQVRLCPGAKTPNVMQYPVKEQAKHGIHPLLTAFLEYDVMRPCESPYTPVLPV